MMKIIATLLLISVMGCSQKPTSQFYFPHFTIVSEESLRVDSKQLAIKNKKILIHFWGTWCSPCISELPIIIEQAKKWESKNIIIYLIAVDDTKVAIDKFLKPYLPLPNNLKIYLDDKKEASRVFETFQLPETYLFNESLILEKKFVGPQNWRSKYFETIF